MILAVLIAFTAWLLTFFLPWWSVAIPGLLFGALLGKTGWSSFGWGLTGIGGLWLIHTLYIHITNDGILTSRIADLFNLSFPSLVIIISVLIGGLIGGATTLTGYLFKKALVNGQNESDSYTV